MVTLKGEHIYLRALEPEDLEFVYAIENTTEFWNLSDTQAPYSRFLIKQYLKFWLDLFFVMKLSYYPDLFLQNL